MGSAFKVVIAFCIGVGALYGAQRMWLTPGVFGAYILLLIWRSRRWRRR